MAAHQSDNSLASYSSKYLATACVLVILTTLSLGCRLYVRVFMLHAWGADDWLLLATYLVFMGLATSLFLLAEAVKEKNPRVAFEKIGTDLIIGETLYIATQIFLKMALAAFFLRILVKRWQRRIIIVSVSIFVTFNTTYLFIQLLRCGTPSWRKLFYPSKCVVSNAALVPLNYTAASLNCITDWIMALFPLAVIRTLNLSRSAKTSIILLTALGLTGSVVSIVRLPLIHLLEAFGNPDFSQVVSSVVLCSNIESAIGIIALSLAAIKPLVLKVMGSCLGDRPTDGSTLAIQEIITASKSWFSTKRTISVSANDKYPEVVEAKCAEEPVHAVDEQFVHKDDLEDKAGA